MRLFTKKSIASLVVGMFILAGAVSPFIVQAAGDNNCSSRPAMHQQHFDPDKMAQNIADTYGVSKEDVLNYQKKGVKFKELSRAALLARASGKSLQEVMALKTPDNTWQDVTKSLGVTKEQIKAVRQDITATKLENKLSIPKQTSLDLLQQGYHSRDIAVANELSKNTGKSISDVLGMKKINNSWHDVANALGVDNTTYKQDMKDLKAAFPHRGHSFRGE